MALVYTWPDNAASRWPNFRDVADSGTDVLRCSCGCGALPDAEFMNDLQKLRSATGRPMTITSGARCEEYDARIGGKGPHTMGAVDVAICGKYAISLLHQALPLGWTGVGLKQHGPKSKRFIHLDRLPVLGFHPRPWVWTYP